MRKIIASEYVSLDSYFAGPNGEIDWFFWDKEIEKYSIDLIGTVDTILFGRVTYEMMASYWTLIFVWAIWLLVSAFGMKSSLKDS